MRRILWLTLLVLLGLPIAGGLVYLTNVFSARTWLLGKALRSSVSSVRATAEKRLARGNPEEAAYAFVEARREAMSGGPDYGESWDRFALLPPEAAGMLAAMLDDVDPLRAAAAADGLTVLVAKNEDHDFSAVLPNLVKALERRQPKLCWSAAAAISSISPGNPDMAKTVLRSLREGCPDNYQLIPGMQLSESDVRDLLEYLVDPMLRTHVASILGLLPSHKERVVPALLGLLENEDVFLVQAALFSLEQLEQRDPATIRRVAELLRRDEARHGAIRLLARSTVESSEALGIVKAGLQESSQAEMFLQELESAETISPDLVPDLVNHCRSGADQQLRLGAIRILAYMGPAARSAVPAIEAILPKESDPHFADEARIALENMKASETAPEDG